MGGIQSGGIASNSNLNELKSVISRTTKVTKVSRGTEQERPEDVTQEVAVEGKEGGGVSDEDEDGTDGDKSMDVVMDTDGN